MTLRRRAAMVPAPMATSALSSLLGDAAGAADSMRSEVLSDRSRLSVLFPGIPRRHGRDVLGGGRQQLGDANVDLDALRRCDAVAAWLLQAVEVTDAELRDLFAHGDMEERTMLLRSLSFLPLGDGTAALLDEVLRTNVVLHMEAALCDSDLLRRCHAAGVIPPATSNRLLLKFAFLDLPLARAIDAEHCASTELSMMLQDLATEREAAGRAVWHGTWYLLGLHPCRGAFGRLLGGIEHGDDRVRLAATAGLLHLADADREAAAQIARFADERLPREPRSDVRAQLQRLVTAAG